MESDQPTDNLNQDIIAKDTEPSIAPQEPKNNEAIHEVLFYGNEKEYFRIWIVNTVLSILTLGIYSAWAKVRNNKYIYQNLSIDGHRFNYHATPIEILRGRLIAVVFLALIVALAFALPTKFLLPMAIIPILLSPFIFNSSLRFNLKMTSYRNLRFYFKGSYGETLWYYTIAPILTIFTLYIALPVALRSQAKYSNDNKTFGSTKFESNPQTSVYYKAFGWSALAGIGITIFSTVVALLFFVDLSNPQAAASPMATVFNLFIYGLYFSIVVSIWQAIIRNHTFSVTEIPEIVKMYSAVEIPSLIRLRLENLGMIVVSLGLLIPFTKIRTIRFFAEATRIGIKPNLEKVVANQQDQQSSVGDALSDSLDMDISLV
ncbi:MAG: YjgN family protein [Bdellovibrionales bacterium]